jgi:hypothetical protein
MTFWQTALIASRLLEYEVWCRLHALGLSAARGDIARELLARIALARIAMIELSPLVLARPHPIRTLDALHLATLDFLRQRPLEPTLASYDQRMVATARSMGIAIAAMD